MSNELNTPVEIDTAIAQKGLELERNNQLIERQERYLASEYSSHLFNALLQQQQVILDQLNDLRDLYTGWTRYYHVTNANGHVHTSMSCSSCFPDTEFAWRTDLSDLTAEQVVEREAYNACSVCMPIAPAEQKAARVAYNKRQREQRAAEKAAAKREKELAKLPRQHSQALKVNELVDQFGLEDKSDAFRATYDKTLYDGKFAYGYDTAYFVWSDMVERNRRTR